MENTYYNKVHLWIGTTKKTREEYEEYFKLDYSAEGDFDDTNYKICGFCNDIDTKWYDQDFIGIIPLFEKEVSLDEIMKEAAIDIDEHQKVKKTFMDLGIEKANAILWYQDEDLALSQPIKETYNDLKYIGLFEGD